MAVVAAEVRIAAAVVAAEVPIAEAVAVAEVAHTAAAVAVAAEVQLLPVAEEAEDADKKKRGTRLFFFSVLQACSLDRAVGLTALCSAVHAPRRGYTRSYRSPVPLWQSWSMPCNR